MTGTVSFSWEEVVTAAFAVGLEDPRPSGSPGALSAGEGPSRYPPRRTETGQESRSGQADPGQLHAWPWEVFSHPEVTRTCG